MRKDASVDRIATQFSVRCSIGRKAVEVEVADSIVQQQV